MECRGKGAGTPSSGLFSSSVEVALIRLQSVKVTGIKRTKLRHEQPSPQTQAFPSRLNIYQHKKKGESRPSSPQFFVFLRTAIAVFWVFFACVHVCNPLLSVHLKGLWVFRPIVLPPLLSNHHQGRRSIVAEAEAPELPTACFYFSKLYCNFTKWFFSM